jgi:hypothetical protein
MDECSFNRALLVSAVNLCAAAEGFSLAGFATIDRILTSNASTSPRPRQWCSMKFSVVSGLKRMGHAFLPQRRLERLPIGLTVSLPSKRIPYKSAIRLQTLHGHIL